MPTARQPALFIPHGGGPCFFMDDPRGIWTSMAGLLRSLPAMLPEPPKAILLISAHWETQGFAFTGGASPDLIYDYYNFPPHTYEIVYPAPGAPELAARAADLLRAADLPAAVDPDHGFDHGVFIPLKVAFPDADVPIVAMSVDASLDPAQHVAAGRALAPLRDEGVVIIGSGLSTHNLRALSDPRFVEPTGAFDAWLTEAATQDAEVRAARLAQWADAPSARLSHPREEHLIPLMVAAGAGAGGGERIYNDTVLNSVVSAYRFD
ncbi:MAG: class III extradiol ring-cleavage dioxygenase [Sphingomonadaceae bacterium]